MDELDDLLDPTIKSTTPSHNVTGSNLPNANATLVLGIISIPGCILYGVPGLICGIIALAIHKKDKDIYKTDPSRFEQSYKNARAGFVCAIIGTSLSAAFLVFFLFAFIFAVSSISTINRF